MSTIEREPEDQTVVDQLEEDQRQILDSIRRTVFSAGDKIGLADLTSDIRLHDAISVVLKYYGGTPTELPNFIRRKA